MDVRMFYNRVKKNTDIFLNVVSTPESTKENPNPEEVKIGTVLFQNRVLTPFIFRKDLWLKVFKEGLKEAVTIDRLKDLRKFMIENRDFQLSVDEINGLIEDSSNFDKEKKNIKAKVKEVWDITVEELYFSKEKYKINKMRKDI